MPGRGGYSAQGGWASGSSSGSTPQSLSIDSRSGNEPPEYKASYSIEFIPDFESGSNDEFIAYIISDNNSSGGSSSGGSGSSIEDNGGYRYGFNGKEIDGEVSGYGNQIDYGMRIYDPRIGRFKSVDPLAKSFAELSSYQYASNTPIKAGDLDGLESSWRPPGQTLGLEDIRSRGDAANQSAGSLQRARQQQEVAVQNQRAQMMALSQPRQTISSDNRTSYQRQQSANISAQHQQLKDLAGATMDRFAAGVSYQTLTTTKAIVQSPLQHGYGIYEGFKEGNGWEVAKNTVGLALDAAPLVIRGSSSLTFYSVQNEENVARLLAGGTPWPTAPTSAHLGSGLYAWATRTEAETYLNLLKESGVNSKLTIMEFSVPKNQFNNFKKFTVPFEDGPANQWLEKHSSLYGEGLPHGYDYIQRGTGVGVEHYFSSNVFPLLKAKK